jgi:transposase-like protein
MAEKIKSLQDAIRYYSDEMTCIDAVALMHWPDGKPRCPKCDGGEHYWLATQKRWKCKACAKQFSVKVGTIFEDSPLSLTKWLPALWMIVNCKNGISSYELSRDLDVSQKAAWFMLHRLRLVMKDFTVYRSKIGGDGNEVEVDETYVGGNPKNMHRDRAKRYTSGVGPGGSKKTIVMGMLDRDLREVRAKVVSNVRRETLQNEILQNVEIGARVYTDDAVAYDNMQDKFIREVVNHSVEYVRGRVHTNGIENFWSLLKRGLKGTYVAVEPFHLDRYIDEQAFRFNNRGTRKEPVSDRERFDRALALVVGKRLTFKEVTGKVGTTPEQF